MPPAYVKPYVKRGKTDAADAEAICEAVTRPTMRFVAVKSREQQGVLMLHKTRDLLVLQRTALINALRAQLAEYGMVTATGPGGVKALTKLLHEEQDDLPEHARGVMVEGHSGRTILEWAEANAVDCIILDSHWTCPGIVPLL